MKYEITYMTESEEKSAEVLKIIASTGATYTVTKDAKAWASPRDLAYTIGKHTKAYYYTGIIETLASNMTQIKQKLNFSPDVIRYLIIKQDA